MKYDCSEFKKQIPGLLLESISAEKQRQLEKHIAECSHCRAEHESYARTLSLLKSAEDEPVPHHFFVYPEESRFNPWQLFRYMKPRWQVLTAGAIALFFLIGLAVISRVQIRSDPSGWSLSFNGNVNDVDALKEDILRTAEERNREARTVWLNEARTEFSRLMTNLTQDQQAELEASLSRLDARLSAKILSAQDNARNDSEKLAMDLYRTVSQQRAEDLDFINLRFNALETSSVIKAQQTNAILDTLLYTTALRIR